MKINFLKLAAHRFAVCLP
uniref:Uncharacterized protein n=1 Tax=Rhizophora mucronata TaxID=61149 RepID=A0A2P2P3D4_RHIMU